MPLAATEPSNARARVEDYELRLGSPAVDDVSAKKTAATMGGAEDELGLGGRDRFGGRQARCCFHNFGGAVRGFHLARGAGLRFGAVLADSISVFGCC